MAATAGLTAVGQRGTSVCAPVGDLLLRLPAAGGPLPRRHRAADWRVAWQADGWDLLAQDPGPRWRGYPLTVVESPACRLWLLGELYGEDGRPSADVLAEIAAAERDPGSLNGHFLLLVWRPDGREWQVWTDRFGTLHGYYAHDGQRGAIGTFCPAVAAAAARRRLDWQGLTGFFSLGFFPGEHTHFEDVTIFRPASRYVFDEGGCLRSRQRYWEWQYRPQAGRPYDDTLDEFAGIFHQVMADLYREGRIAIPISGGLDSRCTVAALPGDPAVHSRIWSYSYGYSPDSVETRIAGRIAAARRLPFEAFTIGPYLFDLMELAVASVEGFQDITQCRQAAVVDEIGEHADRLIAAHWGDVWLDDMGLADEGTVGERQVLEHALHKMRKGGRRWLLEHLCRPHLRDAEPDPLVEDMVAEEMEAYRHLEDPDFRVKALKTDLWSFRWTMTSVRMFQPGAFPRLPFYDRSIADFFSTVPSQEVAGRRLQIDYLKRFAPDLARVTWQDYQANLFQHRHVNTWLLPGRVLRKLGRALSRRTPAQRNWEVQFAGENGREGLEHWLLRPGLKLHGLVSPGAVRQLVDGFHRAPLAGGHAYAICMLLTFSAWLETYG